MFRCKVRGAPRGHIGNSNAFVVNFPAAATVPAPAADVERETMPFLRRTSFCIPLLTAHGALDPRQGGSVNDTYLHRADQVIKNIVKWPCADAPAVGVL